MKIAFLKDGKVVFLASDLSQGVVDIIKYSGLTPTLVSDEVQLGQIVEVPKPEPYVVGDVVFVYHLGKTFRVDRFEEVTKNEVTHLVPVLVEENPANPKFPHELHSVHGHGYYPRLTA